MTNAIVISCWDEDITSDDPVAYVTEFNFKRVHLKEGVPRWANLYGPPVDINSGEEAEKMIRYPDKATCYRGRLLLSLKVEHADDPSSAGVAAKLDAVRGVLRRAASTSPRIWCGCGAEYDSRVVE